MIDNLLINAISEGVVVTDSSGIITTVNPAMEKMFGYKTDELVGQRIEILIPDELKEKHVHHRKKIKDEARSRSMGAGLDLQGRKKDGTKVYVEISLNPFEIDEARFVMAIVSDITIRKEAEMELLDLNLRLEERVAERTKQLEQNQLLYKMIARNFPNGDISVFDENLNYVFLEGQELFKRGITSEMLIGTSFLDRVDPEIRGDIGKKLRSVQRGKNTSFELNVKGRTYLINAVGMPLGDSGVNSILMVTQNITPLKKAEEKVQKSLEKEQQLNELKSRFVSMASHEFRTPLTSVMNSASLISKYIEKSGVESDFTTKQLKHVERIKRSTKHLTTILNDFLSIDKLEHGKIVVSESIFDITEFSNDIIQDMDGLQQHGQQIRYQHYGETSVVLDRQILMNIFNNLLSNAVKYSPDKGLVQLETRIENDMLTAVFEDNGIGIPKKDQAELFSRFFRATNVSDIQGTGLGLNIVKNFVELAGGEIDFESEENVGTKVTVRMPLKN